MANLDLLSTFLEIYRAGSLSAAAERLGLTQPAVSGQLARLERQLGEPLFIRSRQGVTPTQHAAALAARVGLHVEKLRAALDTGDTNPVLRGTIRIGGAAEVMTERVLPALAPLTARGVKIHATLGLAQDLLSALASDRLDLAVSAVRPTAPTVIATPLIDEEFVLVCPQALAHTIDPDRLRTDPAHALSHLPLVVYAPDAPIVRRYWLSEFTRRPPNPIAMVVSDLRAVVAAVAAGAGISVVPTYLASAALAAGTVVQPHRPEVPPLNTLYLATRRGAPATPALTVLRDHLIEAANGWGTL
ncbi:DNA-binding transcriptional regulator, LysR family [Actinokineospora alba]|uniref:DNA-binding transcriptional regulator, LysR family n=1 Tax=Actinokineospora alba TaxID=504798 RepID=A0A1H0LT00_9PSEU|nr:LysR family transcriptional regulator [Actinokineospora alba]TDP67437.1 DNA-binding transcriptional LysR family regulator [Actinokineospora alba]SDI96654.1 DNA-binding transcriptional regulator, LysR family [Actinokineospora alba]SDO71106.1 DNA-binding transcriptional regulator, LysR family [Actinokineospora alba]